MGKLEGKIALVTGGNSGIGLATAKRFASEDAHVFITGRRDGELAAALKEIGKNVTGVQGDVSKLGDIDRLFSQIKREKGRLDIVFANAGVAKYASLGDITEEFYDSIFDINVKGLLFTVQKALPFCQMALPSSSTRQSSPAKGCHRSVFTAPPRPPCARSRAHGRLT
jgi:NAD(P)-dependent dehydrogenase (short-subunit alcohol dehydrogenase family)